MPALPPVDPDAQAHATALRHRLLSAGYTPDGVIDLLGDSAHAALGRGDLAPALEQTAGGAPLATLVRLFLLGSTEPAAAVEELGLGAPYLRAEGSNVRAALDLRPYAEDWFVVSDRRVGPGTVTGVGGASLSLLGAVPPPPPERLTSLDVGTGSGVQALHLAGQGPVVATDSEPRALELAALTLALSGVAGVELRLGSLFEPVAGRRFDRVVSNPPFVVGPADRERLSYRDSGLDGDDLCAQLVRGCADVLTEGGIATLLANWLHVAGTDWRERVAAWLPAGVDARVLQREIQDPAEYVALWAGDAGRTDEHASNQRWLRWFAERTVEAVGFGILTLRRTDGPTRVVVEDARQPLEGLLGPEQARWLSAVDALRGDPAQLVLQPSVDVQLEHRSVPALGEWQELSSTLVGPPPLRWRAEVDDAVIDLVAACDGTRPLGEVAHALAGSDGMGEVVALGAALLERGYLALAVGDSAAGPG